MHGNITIPFEIHYDSGENKFNGLDFYYGSDSIGGMAEAVALTTHAIVNDTVAKQTPSVKGFSLRFKNASTGSYRQRFELEFNTEESVRMINELGVNSYIELLQMYLRIPLGGSTKLERRKAKKRYQDMEDEDDLLKRLHGPLRRIHHPVSGQGYSITLKKSQTPLLKFTHATNEYLTGSTKSSATKTIEVAVSRFNARRCTGRFIDAMDAESVSFSPKLKAGLSRAQKNLMANSLKSLANDEFSTVSAEVTEVYASDGRVKHYILHFIHEEL